MNIEKRIGYLTELIENIKDGTVRSYDLACSEFTAWCCVLKPRANPNQTERINQLESSLESYQQKRSDNLRLLRESKARLLAI